MTQIHNKMTRNRKYRNLIHQIVPACGLTGVLCVDDFLLLLCASLQGRVFEEECVTPVQMLAGDNVEICRDLDAASFSQHNPVPDFIHCRSDRHLRPDLTHYQIQFYIHNYRLYLAFYLMFWSFEILWKFHFKSKITLQICIPCAFSQHLIALQKGLQKDLKKKVILQ